MRRQDCSNLFPSVPSGSASVVASMSFSFSLIHKQYILKGVLNFCNLNSLGTNLESWNKEAKFSRTCVDVECSVIRAYIEVRRRQRGIEFSFKDPFTRRWRFGPIYNILHNFALNLALCKGCRADRGEYVDEVKLKADAICPVAAAAAPIRVVRASAAARL